MFSHVNIGVIDFPKAFAFYDPVLRSLGLVLKFSNPAQNWAAWKQVGIDRPLLLVGHALEGLAAPGNGQQVALLAGSRAAVDECYRVALEHGGVCAGAPGLRPHYHADYYGAYFRDSDGNKMCVCCHQNE